MQKTFGITRTFLVLMALLIAFVTPDASAFLVITVGQPSDNCDYYDLTTALAKTATNPGEENDIFVSGTALYGVDESIDNQDVEIIGGFSNCAAVEPTPGAVTTLTAKRSSRLFNITRNANVYFENLVFTNGAPVGDAGAIYYGASGNLTFVNSQITSNTAANGGGVVVNPLTYANVGLINTSIDHNQATQAGGGLRLLGATTLYADATSKFTLNTAVTGGAIDMEGSVKAYISSQIDSNQASQDGGGIAVLANAAAGSPSPAVNLYGADSGSAVALYNNSASRHGGAIYASSTSGHAVTLCAQDFAFDNNQAADGAAFYGDQTESFIEMNSLSKSCVPPLSSTYTWNVPAVSCGASRTTTILKGNTHFGCNDISNNTANGGSIITFSGIGTMAANRVAARTNVADFLLYMNLNSYDSETVTVLNLTNCLLVDNQVSRNLLVLSSQGADYATGNALLVNGCTIANNSIGGSYVVYNQVNDTTLYDSIIEAYAADNSPIPIFADLTPYSDRTTQHVIVSSNDNLSGPSSLDIDTADQPTFVYSSTFPTLTDDRDYHLLGNLGIDVDLASTAAGDKDLDGGPRVIALSCSHHAKLGPLDLGAYESMGDPDNIFCTRFGD
jgi:predicted outer membrane repeat protein